MNKCQSKTYCVHMFSQVATDNWGYYRPCCHFKNWIPTKEGKNLHVEWMSPLDYFNSKEVQEMRQTIKNGEWVDGCGHCKESEKNGVKSMRQRDNEELNSIAEQVGENLLQEKIYSFDFRAGNLCNLECLMCGPSASSRLDKLFIEKGRENFSSYHLTSKDTEQVYDIRYWYKNEKIIENIIKDTKNIYRLMLLGGEPLINPANFNLLENLIEKGKNLKLEISTNATQLDVKIIKLLENFRTQLKCSIDGVGKISDYIRYPSDFNIIEKNLKILHQSKVSTSIIFTVSVLNIFHLKDFVKWFWQFSEENNVIVSLGISNMVHTPNHLDIRHLPTKLKHKALCDLEDIQQMVGDSEVGERVRTFGGVKELKNYLQVTEGDFQVIKSGWKYVENFDRVRSTDWKNVAPELAEYL